MAIKLTDIMTEFNDVTETFVTPILDKPIGCPTCDENGNCRCDEVVDEKK